MDEEGSTPNANRKRSYSGGYMKVGNEGEDVVLRWLRNLPSVASVEDLREIEEWQRRHVDFRVTMKDGRVILFEVKTDNHLDVTGNWLWEFNRIYLTLPINEAFKLGWSVTSEAEILIFYARTTAIIHVVKMMEYRLGFREACANGDCEWGIVHTDQIKMTHNAYFPDSYIKGKPSYRTHSAPLPNPFSATADVGNPVSTSKPESGTATIIDLKCHTRR